MLRGFYFTSGTQEGTPIDQAIGSMARAFGAEEAAQSAFSGVGFTSCPNAEAANTSIKNVVIEYFIIFLPGVSAYSSSNGQGEWAVIGGR